jgi:hypothetical protein
MAVMPCSKALVRGRQRRLAVDGDLAFVGLVDAGQDLDQRRLAGAVLADERRHLARIELERDLVQRRTPGKRLGDAGQSELWVDIGFTIGACGASPIGTGREPFRFRRAGLAGGGYRRNR